MKLAYSLDRKEKEYLYENFDQILKISVNLEVENIVESLKKKKKPVTIPVEEDNKINPDEDKNKVLYNDDLWESAPLKEESSSVAENMIKTSNLHDPETSEQLVKLIELMEKYLGIEDDISYDNISVFIHPLLNGARKLIVKQYKIMGITRRLHTLSKKYRKYKSSGASKRELDRMKKEFRNLLLNLKKKLNSFEIEVPKIKKIETMIMKSAQFETEIADPELDAFTVKVMEYLQMYPEMKDDPERLRAILNGGGLVVSLDVINKAIDRALS